MRGAALCVVLLVACVQVDILVGAGERRSVCTTAADGRLGRLAARRSAAFGVRKGVHGTCASKRLMEESLSATSRCAVANRRKLRRAPLDAARQEPPSARRCGRAWRHDVEARVFRLLVVSPQTAEHA
jgi:hypothetical protein